MNFSGFLYLQTLFLARGRLDATWAALRAFGYGRDLTLSEAAARARLPRAHGSGGGGSGLQLAPAAAEALAHAFDAQAEVLAAASGSGSGSGGGGGNAVEPLLTRAGVEALFARAPRGPAEAWEAWARLRVATVDAAGPCNSGSGEKSASSSPKRSAGGGGGGGAMTKAAFLCKWRALAALVRSSCVRPQTLAHSVGQASPAAPFPRQLNTLRCAPHPPPNPPTRSPLFSSHVPIRRSRARLSSG